MSRGLPSMTALLGLLAIAGYQNRDKIAEMLGGANKSGGAQGNAGPSGNQGGLGGLLGQLGGALGGASAGGILSGGLGELLERFKQNGQGDTAESWVQKGPNKTCDAAQLEKAIGSDVLDNLTRQTGLTRDELVSRLCRELPDAVDKYTPDGRIPAEA
ncbi:MAG: YidB family protein [Pseudolabrys sp.]|nr:YidB family protein [Pseudolabrys sp.]